jgi:hypothetical protein
MSFLLPSKAIYNKDGVLYTIFTQSHPFSSHAFMLVSVGDITKRLCRLGEDAAQVRERIAHWSRSGVLPAINRRYLSKGTPRLFEHGAIVRAAVLNQLTDMDIDPTSWKYTRSACEQARDAAREWACGNQQKYWLQITWTVGRTFSLRGLPELRVGEITPDPVVAGVVLVNLTQIFQRIGWTAADEREDESMEVPKRTRAKGGGKRQRRRK